MLFRSSKSLSLFICKMEIREVFLLKGFGENEVRTLKAYRVSAQSRATSYEFSQGPVLRRAPCFVYHSAVIMKSLIFKQGARHFHFALSPANSAACPEPSKC